MTIDQTASRPNGRPDKHDHASLATDVAAESRLDKIGAAQRVLLLAEHTRAHVHLVQVPAAVLDLVQAANAQGVRVTAESFLPFMSTTDIPTAGPLGFDRYRRPDEVEALWQAMRSGPIDSVATGHAPHTWEEKQRVTDDLVSSPSGYPELETGLPMMLDAASQGWLTPTRMVDLMCTSRRGLPVSHLARAPLSSVQTRIWSSWTRRGNGRSAATSCVPRPAGHPSTAGKYADESTASSCEARPSRSTER